VIWQEKIDKKPGTVDDKVRKEKIIEIKEKSYILIDQIRFLFYQIDDPK